MLRTYHFQTEGAILLKEKIKTSKETLSLYLFSLSIPLCAFTLLPQCQEGNQLLLLMILI